MVLKATKKDLKEIINAMSMAYSNCIRHIAQESGVTSHHYFLEDGKQCFGFIPYYDYDNTVYILTKLRGNYGYWYKSRPKFLDIGCGIGNIVLLAKAVGYAADGLEYNPKIYEVAKLVCRGTAAKIFKADMNKFDHYGDYDVLYYYQPMTGNTDMNKFTRKLAEKMKPGAYVIAYGSKDVFRKSSEFSNVYGRYVWRKKEK